jgi:hypothetical protein
MSRWTSKRSKRSRINTTNCLPTTPTARRVAERLLRGAVEALSDPRNPRGCFAVQGALACGDAADSVRKELISCCAAGAKRRCAAVSSALRRMSD